jgi:hypothetical protein
MDSLHIDAPRPYPRSPLPLDAALLGLASTDPARGATATEAHALAAAYLSFTGVFGATVVRWADPVARGHQVPRQPDRGRACIAVC